MRTFSTNDPAGPAVTENNASWAPSPRSPSMPRTVDTSAGGRTTSRADRGVLHGSPCRHMGRARRGGGDHRIRRSERGRPDHQSRHHHHLPHARSIPQRFTGDLLNAAYASDLSDMIEARCPALWVHGHTHASCDYVVMTPASSRIRGDTRTKTARSTCGWSSPLTRSERVKIAPGAADLSRAGMTASRPILLI